MLKLRATGRGRHYTPLRGLVESLQSAAYAGAWPARILARIPAAARVSVIEHRLALRPADSERPPLRIAFASDLHVGPLTPAALLENAFRLLADAAPDVLALGGDYVSLDVTDRAAAVIESLVAAVPARTKLAVLGNHDLWTRHEVIERALDRGGARVLVNQAVRLPPPHDDVAIVGIDDAWTGAADPDRAFSETDGASLKVVLTHAPECLPMVAGRGSRLLLCGHTHGGQVATPWGPVVVHGRHGRKRPHGLYGPLDGPDGMYLFVSRGLGNSDLPLRAFAPPDVAVFTIDRRE